MTVAASNGQVLALEPEAPSRYFRALDDPTRLRIIAGMFEDERTVCGLVELPQVPQSRISNHLACLRCCRFVTSEQRGRSGTLSNSQPR
jgi:ArsR family transcriptional regulator, cadmium/lead-responsive transcriptional repressor